jgi:hypothetical protein
MERATIRELSEAVIGELERLGYASETIKLYQRLYRKLLRYADERRIQHHSLDVCHRWLRDSLGIDPTLSSPSLFSNPTQALPLSCLHLLFFFLPLFPPDQEPALLKASPSTASGTSDYGKVLHEGTLKKSCRLHPEGYSYY